MDSVEQFNRISVSDAEILRDISSDQNGLVIVFMPDTTGISSQLQLKNLRNNNHKILTQGWSILVVSSAPPEELSESSDELSLPFKVMHDVENKLANAFNTLGNDFENPYISMRTKRRTYILDSTLSTLHVIDDIHPSNHANEILELLKPENEITSDTLDNPKEKITGN